MTALTRHWRRYAHSPIERQTITDERDPSIATETIRMHRLVRRSRQTAPPRGAGTRAMRSDRGARGGLSR